MVYVLVCLQSLLKKRVVITENLFKLKATFEPGGRVSNLDFMLLYHVIA